MQPKPNPNPSINHNMSDPHRNNHTVPLNSSHHPRTVRSEQNVLSLSVENVFRSSQCHIYTHRNIVHLQHTVISNPHKNIGFFNPKLSSKPQQVRYNNKKFSKTPTFIFIQWKKEKQIKCNVSHLKHMQDTLNTSNSKQLLKLC